MSRGSKFAGTEIPSTRDSFRGKRFTARSTDLFLFCDIAPDGDEDPPATGECAFRSSIFEMLVRTIPVPVTCLVSRLPTKLEGDGGVMEIVHTWFDDAVFVIPLAQRGVNLALEIGGDADGLALVDGHEPVGFLASALEVLHFLKLCA
jgi:hypothetical protein